MTLEALGARLRASGLTPRALAAWAGTDRVAAVRRRLPTGEPMPAATTLALFVGGAEVSAARVPVDELAAHGLVERRGDRVRATVAIVPLGPSLLVCDRHDAPDAPDLVCWPDDSSHHLALAIPRTMSRRARWIDLGCGSAFAQLARPDLATERLGLDINPRALRHATLGAALTGLAARFSHEADGRAELVTCNAPLPAQHDLAVWRRAGDGFFDWLWPAIAEHLAPGGLAVVHAARSAIPQDLAGQRTIVTYAPELAVLWWRPDAPREERIAHRALTIDRPHLDARDLDEQW